MWKLPVFESRTLTASDTDHKADADVVAVFQDAGKKPIPPRGTALRHYAPLVERFRKGEVFAGRHGQTQFVRFGGKAGQSVLLLGLGAPAELTEEKLRQAAGNAWAKLGAEKCQTVVVHLDSLAEGKAAGTPARLARALAEGMLLGAYKFNKYKTVGKSPADDYVGPAKVTFAVHDKSLGQQVARELAEAVAVAESVTVTRDWSNEPSNQGTPEYYAAQAQKLARANGLKCRVLTERDAAREKMGLFLGVGQGAEREGRVVVVEYAPKSARGAKTVAFVGKGVTFDSGGISIKPSMRMEDMKHDMTGAATVMGAVLLAAKWKVPNRVIGIMGFTENMPDGNAIQPGNVLRSRSGKTVEIINTDAEGRLVLADVLDYAQDMKPDAVVDVATLTGAVTIALGKLCCGIMGNDDALIEEIRRAGEKNGERIWQLPAWDEYFDDMKSDYADMKNSVNDSYGGTIRGAMFLKQFIRKGTRWAHLDIAGTAYNAGHLSYLPKKGASGLTVRTLAQFAADF